MSNVINILNKIGYTSLKDLGGHYQMRPLFRDSDNDTALVVKKDTGVYYDFVERRGGSLIELVQRTLKLKELEDARKILKDENFVLEPQNYENKSEIVVQKTFNKNLLVKLKRDNEYWNKRCISDSVLKDFNGGVASNGKMTNRYVFPIWGDKDKLIGFAGRQIVDNNKFPKWILVGQKQKWIYPLISLNYIKNNKSVILVESLGNLLSLYQINIKNVLVTFGVYISDFLIKELLKYDINKIYILFDNDSNNNSVGNKAAIEAKEKLSKYFDEEVIKILTLPQKDVNLMLCNNREELVNFCKKELNAGN